MESKVPICMMHVNLKSMDNKENQVLNKKKSYAQLYPPIATRWKVGDFRSID